MFTPVPSIANAVSRFVRLHTLRSALRLEVLGMRRRGKSAYALIKEELGLKGSRQSVLKQLDELLNM